MSDFLRDYLTVVWFGAIALVLAGLLLGVAALVRPDKPTRQKVMAYESGVDPVGTGWSQSQVRYYIFALLFVVFDVEAVFIFPWAASVERYGTFGLVVMLAFLVLLLDGLAYAWKKGVLRWV
jgi:NADH-quinone oxidoreductase subunit A